jgi:hypothetical protein
MKESFVTIFGSYASLVFTCATILSTGCIYAGDPGHIAADAVRELEANCSLVPNPGVEWVAINLAGVSVPVSSEQM